jgi:hypothetical protein
MLETLLTAVLATTITTGDINIDGRLDEPAWQEAEVFTEFLETMPGENIGPPVKTEAYLLFDDKYFYVGFKCYDPQPEEIRANLGDRDQATTEDAVGISIDLFHDTRRAVDFMVNALGIQIDGTFSDTTFYTTSWDTIWDSAGRITDFGYSVEIAIPFKSLRFANTEIQDWGIVLYRIYPRKFIYNLQSYPNDRDRNCIICQFNTLEGLHGVKPGRNIEIIPSVTALRSDSRPFITGPMVEGDVDVEGSVSAAWGVTPNLTLAGTINPDFSQVETDEIQLDVNERFALFYPEKRPFFMEGTNIFASPLSIVYTRAIVDPDWGLRFTGTEGKNGYGVIVAEDASPNFLMPTNQGSNIYTGEEVGVDSVMSSVLRYRRDFRRDSSIGVIGTHRDGDGYSSTLAGVDGNIRVNKQDFFVFQGLVSETEYPDHVDSETRQGHALYLKYWHATRGWYYEVGYKEIDPEFRADLGFENRVDIKKFGGVAARTWWGDDTQLFTNIIARVVANHVRDFDGLNTDRYFEVSSSASLLHQINVDLGVQSEMTHHNGVDYNQTIVFGNFSIAPSKKFEVYTRYRFGDEVDYLNNRLGTYHRAQAGFTLKPNKHLHFDFSALQDKLWIDQGTVYTANLFVTRAYYYFNSRIFLRGLFQIYDVDRNLDLYTLPLNAKNTDYSTQILFNYKINPFTLAYIGYSDNGVEMDMFSRTTTNRSFFVKLSYAFRP